jgi:hypothetical protein
MTTMALLTPSYRPDLDRFRRLHASVLRCTDRTVVHHVVVPRSDVALFRGIRSPRLRVWAQRALLPPEVRPTARLAAVTRHLPFLPASVNVAATVHGRPWPPVRGWVLQQLVKLGAGRIEADVVVSVDSDVVLLRRFSAGDFHRDGAVRFYSLPDGITPAMGRHVAWCRAAHELLGLPLPDGDTFPDHVVGMIAVDPRLLAGCLTRVEDVTGMPWGEAVTRYRHFSEWTLYGTYVRNLGAAGDLRFTTDRSPLHAYFGSGPMSEAEEAEFIAGFAPDHLGINVQSNSGTDQGVVDRIVARLDERQGV